MRGRRRCRDHHGTDHRDDDRHARPSARVTIHGVKVAGRRFESTPLIDQTIDLYEDAVTYSHGE